MVSVVIRESWKKVGSCRAGFVPVDALGERSDDDVAVHIGRQKAFNPLFFPAHDVGDFRGGKAAHAQTRGERAAGVVQVLVDPGGGLVLMTWPSRPLAVQGLPRVFDSTVRQAGGGGRFLRWGYNGDPVKPTFTPSILVTWGEPSDVPDEFDDESKDRKMICHS